jgi:hypothetical protein
MNQLAQSQSVDTAPNDVPANLWEEHLRDNFEESLARSLESAGIASDRAWELAESAVGKIEALEHVTGSGVSVTRDPESGELSLRFQICGVIAFPGA